MTVIIWLSIILTWYTLGILTGMCIAGWRALKKAAGTRWRDGSLEAFVDGTWRRLSDPT